MRGGIKVECLFGQTVGSGNCTGDSKTERMKHQSFQVFSQTAGMLDMLLRLVKSASIGVQNSKHSICMEKKGKVM